MEGVPTPENKGIIPRTIDWIFANIKNYSNQQFLVRVSFVEIYNEEVRDLLNKNVKNKLNLREKDGAFYVEDCKVIQVENAQQMMGIMMAGGEIRATGATKMNSGSSRSHSIFSIIIENSSIDESGETHYRMGKLNLVDLAGSERR
jgi:kinesin family protein 3/17